MAPGGEMVIFIKLILVSHMGARKENVYLTETTLFFPIPNRLCFTLRASRLGTALVKCVVANVGWNAKLAN